MKVAHNRIDETGNRYGNLTVLGYDRTEGKIVYWLCRCDCGNNTSVRSGQLRRKDRKKTTRCKECGEKRGLVHSHNIKEYVGKQSPTYVCWHSMITRLQRHPNYIGMEIDPRWLVFTNFLKDMGERPSKEYTVDRIDGTKGYFRENCRWATDREQARNKYTNVWIELNGERKILKDWFVDYGLNPWGYYARLKKGLSKEQSLKELLERKLAKQSS
jgi:hypothetical protein